MASNIQIYNMDCMEAIKEMPDKAFDLAIVDPPYGLGKRLSSGGGKHKNSIFRLQYVSKDWDIAPKQEFFNELLMVSREEIIWGGNYFSLPPTRGIICWDKQQFMPTFSRWEYAWTSYDIPSKMIALTNTYDDRQHTTQKPIKLYKWLLKNYAKPGYKILDTHLGSGSIAIACYDMGYEIDKEYYDAAVKRLENHKKQMTLF